MTLHYKYLLLFTIFSECMLFSMEENIAQALDIASDSVNVKATRGEGLGFVGRSEGIAAIAIASITKA